MPTYCAQLRNCRCKGGEAEKYFGISQDVIDKLVDNKDLHENHRGDFMYPYDDNPAMDHSLDQISS